MTAATPASLAITPSRTRTEREATTGPWSRRDLTAVTATTVLSATLLFASWAGTSGEVTLDDQLGWLAVGILGLFLVAVANARCILAGRRAVQHQRAQRVIRRRPLGPVPIGPAKAPALVSGHRMTRYHRADCALAAGKDTTAGSRQVFEGRGLTACGVCRP